MHLQLMHPDNTFISRLVDRYRMNPLFYTGSRTYRGNKQVRRTIAEDGERAMVAMSSKWQKVTGNTVQTTRVCAQASLGSTSKE